MHTFELQKNNQIIASDTKADGYCIYLNKCFKKRLKTIDNNTPDTAHNVHVLGGFQCKQEFI